MAELSRASEAPKLDSSFYERTVADGRKLLARATENKVDLAQEIDKRASDFIETALYNLGALIHDKSIPVATLRARIGQLKVVLEALTPMRDPKDVSPKAAEKIYGTFARKRFHEALLNDYEAVLSKREMEADRNGETQNVDGVESVREIQSARVGKVTRAWMNV